MEAARAAGERHHRLTRRTLQARGRSSDVSLVLPAVIDSTAPILVIVSPPVMDMAWVDRQAREFQRFYQRDERFAVVSYNGLVEAMPGARERKALTDFANEHRAIQERLCVGSATQLDSAAKRAFFQALLWMWDPPSPQSTHATLEECVDWCIARLHASEVPVPLRLRSRVLEMVRALHVSAREQPAVAAARRRR